MENSNLQSELIEKTAETSEIEESRIEIAKKDKNSLRRQKYAETKKDPDFLEMSKEKNALRRQNNAEMKNSPDVSGKTNKKRRLVETALGEEIIDPDLSNA